MRRTDNTYLSFLIDKTLLIRFEAMAHGANISVQSILKPFIIAQMESMLAAIEEEKVGEQR